MALTFNIIYTEKTVDRLLPFVDTLLKHSNCSFRLVNNGCTAQEAKTLEAYCVHSDRMEYYSMEFSDVLEHGKVLNHLQAIERNEYFAFMDSDIFATGPFLERHLKVLKTHDGICSCLPNWYDHQYVEMKDKLANMTGYFLNNHDHFLGVSFYSIYHKSAIQETIQSTGINFQRYTWRQLPEQHKSTLINLGLKKNSYDTAKLLNIFLQQRGRKLVYQSTPNLVHLGGFSSLSSQTKSCYFILRNHLIQNMPSPLRRYLRIIRDPSFGVLSNEELTEIDFQALRHRVTVNYIYHLLDANKSELPEVYLRNMPVSIQHEIIALGQQILELHHQFHSKY